MPSPFLRAPYIAETQSQPHVTHNAGVSLADAIRGRVVLSALEATPPASPIEGDAYILPAGAAGWASADGDDPRPGDIALRYAGAWHRIVPGLGWRFMVADAGRAMIYTASGWRAGDVASALGAGLGLRVVEVVVPLSGASVNVADFIPPRVIVLGVTSWTLSTVTGAASYSVGVPGDDLSKFGSGLGVAAGSNNIGVVGPFATYAPTAVRITSAGGAFTGGSVALALSAIAPSVPV